MTEKEKEEKEERNLKRWFICTTLALITIFFICICTSGNKDDKKTEKNKKTNKKQKNTPRRE